MNLRRTLAAGLALVALALGLSCGGGGDSVTMKPPACSPSVSSLDFGSVPIGSFKDSTFTITNVGQGTLAGTVASPCGDYSIQGTASYSLGAGALATFTVRFTPSQTGPRLCGLDIGSGCATLSCAGIGTSPCEVSPSSLNFGTVLLGQNADLSFTITNTGSGTLSGTVTSPCAEYTFVGNASYTLVGPGFQTITVRFTPTASGTLPCKLDTGIPECHDVTCSGSGAAELASPLLGGGAMYQHTFANAGTYPYHCSIHTTMHGTVIVSAGGPASASVSIQGFSFMPPSVTIGPGGTVTWTNSDGVSHTVTSD